MEYNFREYRNVLADMYKIAKAIKVTSPTPNSYEFAPAAGLNMLILLSREYNIFDELFIKIDTTTVSSLADGVRFDGKRGQDIASALATLRNILPNLLQKLNSFSAPDVEGILHIRFPDTVKDLDDLSTYSKKIHQTIFKTLQTCDLKVDSKIVGLENGSYWVDMLLVSSKAVATASAISAGLIAIGKFLNAAMEARKKYYEGGLLKTKLEEIKHYISEPDYIKKAMEIHQAEYKSLLEIKANELREEFFKSAPEPNECTANIKFAVETLRVLIDEGLVVLPSPKSGERVQQTFPKTEEYKELDKAKIAIDGESLNKTGHF